VAKRRKSLTQGKNLSQGEKILSQRENPSKISLPLVKNPHLVGGKPSLQEEKTLHQEKNPLAKEKTLCGK